MKRSFQIFVIAAALAISGMTLSAQQPSRDKTKLTDAQSDTTRGMYNNDGTTKKSRHHMHDSTRTKTMKHGSKRDTTDMKSEPDNTRRNKRDTSKTHLTPMDQSNKSGDLETTRKIRSEIMKLDGVSSNAKNIKIITVNGHVTLRGPVKTEDEKQKIAEIAERIASAGKVDNQLEVEGNEDNK